jgi:membrane-bound serine protease (ClpP class)
MVLPVVFLKLRVVALAIMRRLPLYVLVILFWSLPVAAQKVISITVDATINPATADYIHRAIEKATKEKAECLLIHLNTPGGLLKSTRVIVSDILESPVPVIVYVSPGGAHAGSAGVFITLAAHIAAMAPGTNIGAAHPVSGQGQMDTIMNEKVTNDAMAFIRSIAGKRQRNVAWAVQSVQNSVSLTEKEALDSNVINLIAANEQDLLEQVNGKSVSVNNQPQLLHTKGATVQQLEMGFAEKMLNILSDPNVAYILFLLGLYGLLFELYNPGAILPGIIGGISIILALYAMHTLPVNYAGAALIVFGVLLFLLEIKIASHGVLGIGGVASLLLGSVMLIRSDQDWEVAKLSWTVIITAVVITSAFFLFVIGLGLKAQRARPVTGMLAMIGETGEAMSILSPSGMVKVHGELWKAWSDKGVIQPGEKVRVIAVQDLRLQVELIN